MLMYMAIVGAMAVMSIRVYTEYSTKVKRAKLQEQIEEIKTKGRTLMFGSKLNPNNIKLSDRIAFAGISMKDPWGNDLTVGGGSCIDIKIQKLSEADCLYISNMQTSTCKWGSVTYHKTVINTSCCSEGKLGEIHGACRSGDSNAVVFYFSQSWRD
jgi:hypothetical protein